ncbi:MAG TPA: flagellar biosynthesis protein FlhF [Bryobacteraceae bacterium]|nr:flagellar biosynthesis protein FlhF [Bryobacteraceae bacterium]
MKIKSYYASTISGAIAMARQELGPDAMLVTSRPAPIEARHLGEYEVVFAVTPESHLGAPSPVETPPESSGSGERLGREIAELKKQLDSMRRALNKSAFTPAQWLGKSPGLSEAYSLLTANEVAPQLALEVVQAAAARSGNPDSREPQNQDSHWYRAVAEEVQSRIQVEAALGAGETLPRITALVGPPGAGKTTTLVKLAVHYGLAARRPVLMLSTDTYRIGAADQLRSYAAILGIGFQVLETVSSLAQTIEENRGKELILIDTAGLALSDLESSAALARLLSTRKDIDRQLVLSSSMKPADLTRVIDAYEIFRPRRLLFTKLDETSSLGPIFNEAVRTRKPLSFFTAGQRIPEDLETASQRRLIETILGSQPPEALSAA